MKKNDSIPEIQKICADLAAQMGYEIDETAFEKEATGLYLRIYVDKPAGITLDDCEQFHRAVQPKLERYDYDFLEVSSPGIDRPIKTLKDAERAKGKEVELRLFKPLEGQKQLIGVFLSLDENGYHLEIAGEERVFPKKMVAVVRCLVDLSALEKDSDTAEKEEA